MLFIIYRFCYQKPSNKIKKTPLAHEINRENITITYTLNTNEQSL